MVRTTAEFLCSSDTKFASKGGPQQHLYLMPTVRLSHPSTANLIPKVFMNAMVDHKKEIKINDL